ncbi:MAG: phosphoribosylanthranilate isomerase [Candidatus Latescibacteria bacterium]|nr:phosphoribosylanthranilate isomerase [Candidatus Latescibacterota bacterium]
MVRAKVCGITNRDDALYAVDAGVDALGFIFYTKSPRYVTPEIVGEIVAELPPFVIPVGVFVNASEARMDAVVKLAGLRAIQLHGDEPPEACLGHAVPVIRALRVGVDFEPEQMRSYLVDTYLLDTAKSGKYGGTGETFDWTKAIAAKEMGRIVLSGGLNPDNVTDAMEAVQPYAVDIGSGVEAKPGKKDPQKVKQFLKTVRSFELNA